MNIIVVNTHSHLLDKFACAASCDLSIRANCIDDLYSRSDAIGSCDLVVIDEESLTYGDSGPFISAIRKQGIHTPVLVTGKSSDSARIASLIDYGADNYQHSSIEPRALVAFSRAIIRRNNRARQKPKDIFFGANSEFVYNPNENKFYVNLPDGKKMLQLSLYEHDLLAALCQNSASGVVKRKDINEALYGTAEGTAANTIEVLIARLRRKFGETGATNIILTVRGEGYLLQTPVTARPPKPMASVKSL